MSDKELIKLLKSSPEQGLAAVVLRYTGYVMKIARTKLDNICTPEDIEETVSDIFFCFYQQGQKCGFEIRSLRAYISLIAERRCIDVFRQHIRREDTVSLDDTDGVSEPIDNDDHDTLAEGIKRLGEPDTSIFIRKYFYGQKTSDIAKELHMKPNTVDKRISRGLVKLRKIMEEEK
ncbi:MAG: sigma-70 family RNA polymerase sigma factor [Oscillospiraceae bacterium]|nr:sigma-70 family RNA polymerase sigma factor [Oscillospiraceae bacterium]